MISSSLSLVGFLLHLGVAAAALCTTPPIGRAIETAASADELLVAGARIESPFAPFSKPHLSQDLHQLKRQQMASNALERLDKILVGSGAKQQRRATMRDSRLLHLLSCAAAPSVAREDGEDPLLDEQSARAVVRSLTSIATLCAADAADCAGADRESLRPLCTGALQLAQRAEALSPVLRGTEAVSCRWATRRLFGTSLDTPRLDAVAICFPFDVHPGLVALPVSQGSGLGLTGPEASSPQPPPSSGTPLPSVAALLPELRVANLQDSIPFVQAELLTADGRRVRERRHTAWLAEEGIGALAYSGKLMNPLSMEQSAIVCRLRDALAADLSERFDCALCNLYVAGGQAACAWHRDPEHGDGDSIDGAKWARPTYVVSAGETRRFAFRPYRGPDARMDSESEAGDRHVISLFSGDVVAMDGDCNDAFEHSVLAGQGKHNDGPRVSIVFKRALVGGDGRRGHTLQGQGRRARARAATTASGDDNELSPPSPGTSGKRGKRGGGAGRGGRGGNARGRNPAGNGSKSAGSRRVSATGRSKR